MATTISSLQSICRPNFHAIPTTHSSLLTFPNANASVRKHNVVRSSRSSLLVKTNKCRGIRLGIRAVDEETVAEVAAEGEVEAVAASEQPVSVTVSPSDLLTMFFQAEGTMSEAAIPSVTKALELAEGVANLKVEILEGIARVELEKQTTVQATGVASSIVEIIQGSGFKLQTLNLSFDDEEEVAAALA